MTQVRNSRVALNASLLKDLRHKHCLSQQSLVELCDVKNCSVSIASIKRAEAGKKVLFRIAHNIAAIYNLNAIDLLATDKIANDVQKSTAKIADQEKLLLVLNYKFTSDLIFIEHQLNFFKYYLDSKNKLIRLIVGDENYYSDDIKLVNLLWQKLRGFFGLDVRACVSLEVIGDTISLAHYTIPENCAWGHLLACAKIASSGYFIELTKARFDLGNNLAWTAVTTATSQCDCIGREVELSLLSMLYQTIDNGGYGEVVLLRGVPGIGKTHLLKDFLKKIQQQCRGILQNSQYQQQFIYINCSNREPVVEFTRSLLGIGLEKGDSCVRELLAGLCLPNISLVTVLQLLGVNLLDAEKKMMIPNQRLHQDAYLKTLLEIVKWKSHSTPLVLCFDDIQDTDDSMSRFVRLIS